MKVKKYFSLLILGLFLMSFMVPMVAAPSHPQDDIGAGSGVDVSDVTAGEAGGAVRGFVNGIGEFIDGLAGGNLLGEDPGGNEALTRAFFAILLGMLVYSAISSSGFFKNPLVLWIATGVITALSLIGLPSSFLFAIRTQYNIMGAVLLSVIPFAIIFWFTIKANSKLVAIFTWVFYTVYFFVLNIHVLASKARIEWPHAIALVVGIIMIALVGKFRGWYFKVALGSESERAIDANTQRKAGLDVEADRLASTTGISQGGK